ncbi:MAG: hypothetical protein ACT4O3_09060 [Elusimicrobiota bacterium]
MTEKDVEQYREEQESKLVIRDRRASTQIVEEEAQERNRLQAERDRKQAEKDRERSEKGYATEDRRASQGEGVRKPWETSSDESLADVVPLESARKNRFVRGLARAAAVLAVVTPLALFADVPSIFAAGAALQTAAPLVSMDLAAILNPVLGAMLILGLLVPFAAHEVRMKFSRTYRNARIRQGLNSMDSTALIAGASPLETGGRRFVVDRWGAAQQAAEKLIPVVLSPVRSLRKPGLRAEHRSSTDIETAADRGHVFAKLAPFFRNMRGIGTFRLPNKIYAMGEGLKEIARNPLGVIGHTHAVEAEPGTSRSEAVRRLIESLSLQDVITTLQTESMMGFVMTPDGLHRIYYEVINEGKNGLKVQIHDQGGQVGEKSWAELVAKAMRKNEMIHLTIRDPRTGEPAAIEVPSDALMLLAYFEPKNLAAFFGASSPDEVREFLGNVSKRTRANPAVQRMLESAEDRPSGAGLVAAYMPKYIGTLVTMSPAGGAAAAGGVAVSASPSVSMSAGLGSSLSLGIRQGLERLGVQPPSGAAAGRAPEEAGEFVSASVLVADADPAAPRDVLVSLINLLMFSKDSGGHLRVLVLADRLSLAQRLRLLASIYLRADTRAAYRHGRIVLADEAELAGVLKDGKIDFAGLLGSIPRMFKIKGEVSLGILADESRFIVSDDHRALFSRLLLRILPGLPLSMEKLFHALIDGTRVVDLSA